MPSQLANSQTFCFQPLRDNSRMARHPVAIAPILVTLKANSRLSCVVSIFPVIGNAGIAENKSDQFGKTRFGANVVRENQDTTLTGLHANQGVGGLAVVSALVKAVALRAVEERDAQPRVQVLALLSWRQIRKEEGELASGGYMQHRPCDLSP